MAESNRWSYIDLLECIAIYFVLVYHTTLYSFDFLNEGTLFNYFAYFFRTILSTCVPIFFFANGYLLFNRPFVLKKHIYKTLKLVLLVFIWAAILMPILYVDGRTEYISKLFQNQFQSVFLNNCPRKSIDTVFF